MGQGENWTHPTHSADTFIESEYLVDAAGGGGVVGFEFAKEVDLVVVVSQGVALVARVVTRNPGDATTEPTATKGAACFHLVPTYLPHRTKTVRVFAPVGTTITVFGYRYAPGSVSQ